MSLHSSHAFRNSSLAVDASLNSANRYSSEGDAAKKADVQEGGHENILTTQEYVKNLNEDMSEDDHFTQGPWVSAIVYLQGQGVIASGCLGDVENIPKMGSLN
uniref:Uncharacterized protein n=1 Tax=Tanacetum cinerariifolium TaxID=118510 RepID=A0A699JMI2_TANCI|nr:hypothetical protein [Tanacetum cinerariifolium]